MKIFSFLMIAVLSAFASGCTPYHAQGAGVGAVIGGVAGALLDDRNPWRGGVIGGSLGAAAGASFTDISMRASREAVYSGRPVLYRTDNGRGVCRVEPIAYNRRTNCYRIHERVWDDGWLIQDRIREVCG